MGTFPNPLFSRFAPAPYLDPADFDTTMPPSAFVDFASLSIGNAASPTDGWDAAYGATLSAFPSAINITANLEKCYGDLVPILPGIQNFDAAPITQMILDARAGSDSGIDAVTGAIKTNPFLQPPPTPSGAPGSGAGGSGGSIGGKVGGTNCLANPGQCSFLPPGGPLTPVDAPADPTEGLTSIKRFVRALRGRRPAPAPPPLTRTATGGKIAQEK